MIGVIKSVVPRAVRAPLRAAFDFTRDRLTKSRTSHAIRDDLRDLWDRARGRHDPLVPPRKLVAGIGGDLHNGARFVELFRDVGRLAPDSAVLDVGCGIGRMALPLTRFLSPAGRYEGFDIIPANVAWCRKAITPRWPNFRFAHADIFNREYNPRGRVRGEEYRFPYADGSFDFAYLTSVFTHMLPAEVTHYLSELGRVLKPGGRCFATFFLLNAESDRLIDAGRATFALHPWDTYSRVHSVAVPEMAVALDEAYVFAAATAGGLAVLPPVRYGVWCGRADGADYQDVVLFDRKVSGGSTVAPREHI